MILQSLVKYYEILAEDESSDIPRLGYSKTGVSYALNISMGGELLGVIPLKVPGENGKKMVSQPFQLPIKLRKTSEIASNFLFDNSNYLLGIGFNKKEQCNSLSEENFEAFKNLHNKILKNLDSDKSKALLNFINNWDIKKAFEQTLVLENLSELISSENIVFLLDGQGFIHNDREIKEKWEEYYSSKNINAKVFQCLVTGNEGPIEVIHPKISGVGGTNPALVSFDIDSDAYNSYGKEGQQGINSPVSKYASFAYGTVLNYLINTKKNKINLGCDKQKVKDISENRFENYKGRNSETTVIFWAESSNAIYEKTFEGLFEPNINDKSAITDTVLKDIFIKIKNAQPINLDNINQDTKFYILGLSPAKGRLAIKFFIQDSFGSLVKKITEHYNNLMIEKEKDFNFDFIPVYILLAQTISQKTNDNSAKSNIESALLRAIISGSPYPAALFNSIMIRIRAEHDINYYKAAIIKAYLLRNSNKYKEVLTVSLNEQSNNRAYVLGRLFAVLEKAQQDASDGQLKSTIKDKYFTSACATPASVFPILLRLSQHHISKAEYGKSSDIKISGILDMLDIENNPIPAHLALEEQGVFVLGYYHQKNELYKKNNQKEN